MKKEKYSNCVKRHRTKNGFIKCQGTLEFYKIENKGTSDEKRHYKCTHCKNSGYVMPFITNNIFKGGRK